MKKTINDKIVWKGLSKTRKLFIKWWFERYKFKLPDRITVNDYEEFFRYCNIYISYKLNLSIKWNKEDYITTKEVEFVERWRAIIDIPFMDGNEHYQEISKVIHQGDIENANRDDLLLLKENVFYYCASMLDSILAKKDHPLLLNRSQLIIKKKKK